MDISLDKSSNTNLVIIPSRSRPENITRAINALKENSVISDFCVALDDDDEANYPRIDGVIYEVNPRLRMNKTLNLVANKYADKYETIFFMGDDHNPTTKAWDETLYGPIKSIGYGLSYGNDLLQGQALATAVMMSTNIIKAIGYMAPPELIHLFMDNFWMRIGSTIKSLWYFDAVIIEHLHYINGKATQDEQYKEVNSGEVFEHDQKAFAKYIEEQFDNDINKLKAELL